jgi:hypothetical protein
MPPSHRSYTLDDLADALLAERRYQGAAEALRPEYRYSLRGMSED